MDYKPKGYLEFAYIDKEIKTRFYEYHEFEKEFFSIKITGDLVSGEEFYDWVDHGSIIDYDGFLSHVFIDGCRSNLGLTHKGLTQGEFLVDGPTWLEICANYNVQVEWSNK